MGLEDTQQGHQRAMTAECRGVE